MAGISGKTSKMFVKILQEMLLLNDLERPH